MTYSLGSRKQSQRRPRDNKEDVATRGEPRTPGELGRDPGTAASAATYISAQAPKKKIGMPSNALPSRPSVHASGIVRNEPAVGITDSKTAGGAVC